MLLRLLTITFLALLPLTLPQPATARSEGIAIVVNDGLISFSDIHNRLILIIESSGLPNTQETRDRLLPQIVGSLVEEELQRQEATRLGITINPEDTQKTFAEIAQSNNLTADQFRQAMTKRGVPLNSLMRQIEAQNAWRQVFAASLFPKVRISDTDINAFTQRLQNMIGKKEYLLSEIFLPVETAKDEQNIKQLANKVVRDLRAKKASFPAVASQISKAPGAAQGGMKGWVQAAQLDPNIANTIQTMDKKAISIPIRSLAGYHILYLADTRTITQDSIPPADKVKDILFQQRADRISRGRLRDLKSSAFIEYRL